MFEHVYKILNLLINLLNSLQILYIYICYNLLLYFYSTQLIICHYLICTNYILQQDLNFFFFLSRQIRFQSKLKLEN